jgi:hypothetical protein
MSGWQPLLLEWAKLGELVSLNLIVNLLSQYFGRSGRHFLNEMCR